MAVECYLVDDGDLVLKTSCEDDGKVVSVSKGDEKYDWAEETAKDFIKDVGDVTISQLARYFGRGTEMMAPDDYDSSRRVQKRGEEQATEEAEVDLRVAGEIVKADEEQQIVFGWAYVMQGKDGSQVVDKSGDFVDDIEELEKSAYDYVLRSRASDHGHSNVQSGQMVESIVFTPEKIEKMGLPEGSVPLGWWTGYKLDDEGWKAYKAGATAFSIHGAGTRTKVAPDQ